MFIETKYEALSGYLMVMVLFGAIILSGIGMFVIPVFGVILIPVILFFLRGFYINNPNEAKLLILFGIYKGVAKESGFFWVNPFVSKRTISLRARSLNGQTLKVNDKLGNPIEIAAVVVWQVQDSAKALLEVDDYLKFVVVQNEAAVRHLANTFAYDNIDDDNDGVTFTLRGGGDKVNELLEKELNERLSRAGIIALEARISHLAYSSEIAGAMLQRQQATAVVAARRQIVEGAVGMVQMALAKLSEHQIVELDEERKAAMVSNLLVVLCGEKSVHPVVNAGTLHH